MDALRLIPGEWVTVPETRVAVRWDGDREVTVTRLPGGYWDLSRLASPGRVLLWSCLVDHPEMPPWPVMPSPSRRLGGIYLGGGRLP